MNLIKCTECGKEFSINAKACPNCACPIENVKENLYNTSKKQLESCNSINDLNKLYELLNNFEALSSFTDTKKEILATKEKINSLSVSKKESDKINQEKKKKNMKLAIALCITIPVLLIIGVMITNSIMTAVANQNPYYYLSWDNGSTRTFHTGGMSKTVFDSNLHFIESNGQSGGKIFINHVFYKTADNGKYSSLCFRNSNGALDQSKCDIESTDSYYTAEKNEDGTITVEFSLKDSNYNNIDYKCIATTTSKGIELSCDHDLLAWTKYKTYPIYSFISDGTFITGEK